MKRRAENATNIVWAGHVKHDEIERQLSHHHVLALPSLWPENAPIIVREALAMGRYVICSREGGSKEFGQHLCLVRPGTSEDIVVALQRIMAHDVQLPIPKANPSMQQHIDELIRIADQVIAKDPLLKKMVPKTDQETPVT